MFFIGSGQNFKVFSSQNKMTKLKNKRGISIIKILILGFIIVLILGYFRISLREVVQSPNTKDNLHYVGEMGTKLWNNYLKQPVSYFWNNIWIPIIWQPFMSANNPLGKK
jgi:hypothetical protein